MPTPAINAPHASWQPQPSGTTHRLAGFLNILDLGAADVQKHGDALDRLRSGELQAVVIANCLSPGLLPQLVDRLERNDPPFLKTWFPPAFHACFYGRNLNLTDLDEVDYFGDSERFHAHLAELLPAGPTLSERLQRLLSELDHGRPFAAAPGPAPGQRYMFTTLRGHFSQGYIPAHFDNEMRLRPSYRHLAGIVERHILSFVLAFSQAESGGALEVFDLRCDPDDARFLNDDHVLAKPDTAALASVSFALPPGSMIVLDSGRFLHRLTRVVGAQTRWSACSFMARSVSGDATWCWG